MLSSKSNEVTVAGRIQSHIHPDVKAPIVYLASGSLSFNSGFKACISFLLEFMDSVTDLAAT